MIMIASGDTHSSWIIHIVLFSDGDEERYALFRILDVMLLNEKKGRRNIQTIVWTQNDSERAVMQDGENRKKYDFTCLSCKMIDKMRLSL